MVDISNVFAITDQLSKQVVGYYDGGINRLNSQLYRINGIDFRITDKRPSLYLVDLAMDNSGFRAYADEVLTYEDIVFIYNNTKRLFDQSKEIFKGCFNRSIMPLKNDLDTLKKLIDQYEALGLIVQEDDLPIDDNGTLYV